MKKYMRNSNEKIILVDKDDKPAGIGIKEDVHRKGLLHRAFSVFILNGKKELLLQRRALEKYHSPGLWTNTCCSHPRPKESTLQAAHRRLKEEMGMDCDLQEIFSFIYKASFDNDLTEHEFDHVFIGYFEGEISPDKKEVDSFKWADLKYIKDDLIKNPDTYTAWFRICFDKVYDHVLNMGKIS